MPADFATDLCGYRAHGKPNTSDASESFSVELGNALFAAMGIAPAAKGDEPTGTPFALRVASDLRARLGEAGSTLTVTPEKPLNDFDQFRHVGVLKGIRPEPTRQFTRAWDNLVKYIRRQITSPPRDVNRLNDLIAVIDAEIGRETEIRRLVLDQIAEESLLKLDVTVAREVNGNHSAPVDVPVLEVGLSLKWSLRTDRAQDCRSQGAKMAALRRGRMPHFAAVTMEPRPYMLNLLGGGSGDVDCVYHLDLPALTTAIEQTCEGSTRRRTTLSTFRRLVAQGRLRDYDELVSYLHTL